MKPKPRGLNFVRFVLLVRIVLLVVIGTLVVIRTMLPLVLLLQLELRAHYEQKLDPWKSPTTYKLLEPSRQARG